MTQVTRVVTVLSSQGLHARPAKLFAETAKDSGLSVSAGKVDGKMVNAASILGILSLGVARGDELMLAAEGDGAEAVLDKLQAVVETDHDEE